MLDLDSTYSPLLACGVAGAVLHAWKRNTLLQIARMEIRVSWTRRRALRCCPISLFEASSRRRTPTPSRLVSSCLDEPPPSKQGQSGRSSHNLVIIGQLQIDGDRSWKMTIGQ